MTSDPKGIAVAGVARKQAAVVRELFDRGLLSVDEAVHRGLVVTDASVSHLSAWVDVGGERRFFVKQADPVRSHGRDLLCEAAVYRLATSHPQIAEVVPACRFIGADGSLIVLDAIADPPLSQSINYYYYWWRSRPGAAARQFGSIMRGLGRSLARVHSVRPSNFGQSPWLLVALEPGWGGYGWLPQACSGFLMGLARMPALRREFARSASDWRAEVLVHGDLRWSNVLAAVDAEPPTVRLIDWELACLGDPAWDLGSVLAEILAGPAYSGQGIELSADALASVRAFLDGYRSGATLADDEWLSLLDRSVRLAGIKLVQMVIECGHQSEALMTVFAPLVIPWIIEHLVHTAAISAAYGPQDGS